MTYEEWLTTRNRIKALKKDADEEMRKRDAAYETAAMHTANIDRVWSEISELKRRLSSDL